MQKPKYFLRYGFIIQKLRNCKEATFKEIKDYLELQSELTDFDLNISKRTFDRDKNEILSLFNVLIEYDHSRKVYYIDDVDQTGINDRMLEAFDMFNSLNMSDSNAPYIIFEKRKPQGTEHFYGLLHAIKNHLLIKFTYTKFWDDDCSIRSVEPYALKESRYRWYLIAKDKKDNVIKTFGLDRISDIEITKSKFIYPKDYNPNEIFKHSFGILTNPGKEPKEVVLSFDPFQGKYIKSFPLHEPVDYIVDDENELRISMKVHITEDFIMEILSYGDDLKVLAPQSLINKIEKTLLKTLDNYK
jgi:predicted DNA-binding transcriptional regulator YafY